MVPRRAVPHGGDTLVVLMLGLHHSDRRYKIIFEAISANPVDEALEEIMRRYVGRLEYHCDGGAPYSWFNFYDCRA